MKMFAVRNISMCMKDCLCLYVCPTGATDTENSIIDTDKCNGCGVCAKACPSGAISMVPQELPPQQKKSDDVIAVLTELAGRKAVQEKSALEIASGTDKDGLYRLIKAIAKSERLVAEDILREAGYMLPQSAQTHALLEYAGQNSDITAETEKLRALVPCNEGKAVTEKYSCLVCRNVFSSADGHNTKCPLCGAGIEKLEKLSE